MPSLLKQTATRLWLENERDYDLNAQVFPSPLHDRWCLGLLKLTNFLQQGGTKYAEWSLYAGLARVQHLLDTGDSGDCLLFLSVVPAGNLCSFHLSQVLQESQRRTWLTVWNIFRQWEHREVWQKLWKFLRSDQLEWPCITHMWGGESLQSTWNQSNEQRWVEIDGFIASLREKPLYLGLLKLSNPASPCLWKDELCTAGCHCHWPIKLRHLTL